MAYNQIIPISTDNLSVSQPQMQNNFLAIYNAFNLNHVALNSTNPTQGKHSFVEMPNQSASAPVTIANEVGLYCNSSALTNQPELFFIKQFGSTAPANLLPPISNNGYAISASNYTALNGWTRLPSGILLMWGTASALGTNSVTVTLPISASIPNFYTIYQVFITSKRISGSAPNQISLPASLGSLTQPTNGGTPTPGIFNIFGDSAGVGANYLVIGV